MTSHKQTRKRNEQVAILILVIFVFFLVITTTSPEVIDWIFTYRYILILIGVALIASFIWYKHSHRIPHNAVDVSLLKALSTMDTTASWYRDEEEANKELVLCCKMNGLNATYQHQLPSGRIADALVNGYLIEGKLSPDVAETDRLLGQMSEYGQLHYQTSIVIYGTLSPSARNRIEHEIRQRYSNKISLVYLSNPQRQRSLSYWSA